MPLLLLKQINCLKTHRQNQPDELQCRLLADEQEVVHFTQVMHAGDQWTLQEPIFFVNTAAIQLWEDGKLKPFFIGQTDVYADNNIFPPDIQTDNLTNGSAHYQAIYQITDATQNPNLPDDNPAPEPNAVNLEPYSATHRGLPNPLPAAPKQNAVYKSSFLPTTHGFTFANYFSVKLPFINAQNTTYGLCGGMVKAAADFFVHHIPLPTAAQIPPVKSPLYRYLFKRQLQSFGTAYTYLGKFFAWWMLYSDSKVQQLTLAEWHTLKLQLQQRQLVQLGVVYVSHKQGRLWENHQVLAYGYEEISEQLWHIFIYDPNYPRRDNVYIKAQQVTFTLGNANTPTPLLICEQHVPGWLTKPVRGFFAMPLSPRKPPALV